MSATAFIAVTCEGCQASLRVPPKHAGKLGRCPRCQAELRIPRSPGEPSDHQSARFDQPAELLNALGDSFRGEMPRKRVGIAYRLAAFLVFVAMLLLPVLYFGCIIGAGVFVYWYATSCVGVVKSARWVWLGAMLYAAPLVAGVTLVLFLLKPLFARRPRAEKLKRLNHAEEPVLFGLVTLIARAVGAPEPKCIAVDCQVNASASLGDNVLGVFGRSLTLTIGLPLVAGLNVQQLAGVVAHELGHFAQGSGMRLTYVIRRINGWFARAVFERDSWDETLIRWSEESDRLALIFLLTRLCLGVSRIVLFVFTAIAHALSCFLLRQMEYDADAQEASLVGSKTFTETTRRLAALGAASALADQLLYLHLKDGRLPEDLPALIVLLTDRMPTKLRGEVEKQFGTERTGIFDTHPSDRDRVERVRRQATEGVFQFNQAASILFRDYRKLCRAATRSCHAQVLGRKVTPQELVPVATILASDRRTHN